MSVFAPADILVPRVDEMEKWAVIACDQFTSQPEYWDEVQDYVGDAPSSLDLILPEVKLTGDCRAEIERINTNMKQYLADERFQEYKNAFVYVERTMQNGTIRKGIVGRIDLEEYDYAPDAVSAIRATEKTVEERIPPRKKIREQAVLELPHILLLCDDEKNQLFQDLLQAKEQLPKLYDFDLMKNGGHITGWLVQGAAAGAFCSRLDVFAAEAASQYQEPGKVPMLFAVGDGNHSLATAKAVYEELKKKYPEQDLSDHPARYALVELENIHEEALQFEPIHRIVTGVEPDYLLEKIRTICADDGYPITWYAGDRSGVIYLDRKKGQLAIGILQPFLDTYLKENSGEIDYIHGDNTLKRLAERDHAIGFLLPPMEKKQLFCGIIADGVLPRKTFSMGHAEEKRYYIEARKIQ
jgi:hypothetical protein